VKRFASWDGLQIAYREWGRRATALPPIVLHHGFVADAEVNWLATGVVGALTAAGRHVIAPDARGHGSSDKPHEPGRYGEQRMARDLAALLDEVGAERVDLVGYSMGAIVALIFSSEGARVRRLIVGGVGSGVIECGGVDRRGLSNESIIHALSVDDGANLEGSRARPYRVLADALDADRQALVAQARSVHRAGVALGRISAPTLVLAGDRDPMAVRPEVLAAAIPDGRLELVRGDHFGALADPRFAATIVDFLA